MKRLLMISTVLALTIGVSACSDDSDDNKKTEPSKPEPSKPEPSTHTVVQKTLSIVKTIDNIGKYPNQVVVDGDYAYIVDSGNNTINRVDLTKNELINDYTKPYIDLGANTNPYAMTVNGNDIYIANSKANTIVKVSKSDTTNIETVASANDRIFGPMDVVLYQNEIHVANSEYDFNAGTAEGSLITLASSGSVRKPVETKNPSSAFVNDNGLVLVCSGEYVYDDNYALSGTKGSGVAVWSGAVTADPKYILKGEDVGKVAYAADHYVVGTGLKSVVHVVSSDLSKTAALDLRTDNGYAMIVPVTVSDEVVVLANFNSDTLYTLNLKSDAAKAWLAGGADDEVAAEVKATAFALSNSSVDKKGPLSMAWDKARNNLLVLNSSSETLDIISVK